MSLPWRWSRKGEWCELNQTYLPSVFGLKYFFFNANQKIYFWCAPLKNSPSESARKQFFVTLVASQLTQISYFSLGWVSYPMRKLMSWYTEMLPNFVRVLRITNRELLELIYLILGWAHVVCAWAFPKVGFWYLRFVWFNQGRNSGKQHQQSNGGSLFIFLYGFEDFNYHWSNHQSIRWTEKDGISEYTKVSLRQGQKHSGSCHNENSCLKQKAAVYELQVAQESSSDAAKRGKYADNHVNCRALVGQNTKVITMLHLKMPANVS